MKVVSTKYHTTIDIMGKPYSVNMDGLDGRAVLFTGTTEALLSW